MVGMSAPSAARGVATQTRYSVASTGTATSTVVAAAGTPCASTSRYSWCDGTRNRERKREKTCACVKDDAE